VIDVDDVGEDVREAVHVQATAKASGYVLWWLWLNGKWVN